MRTQLTPGTKFVLLHSIGHPAVDDLMKKVYAICELTCCRNELTLDADAVMKNPFHTPEMPINSSLFESRLQTLMQSVNEAPAR